MILVAFIVFIWLIVLQITVNRLQEQIDNLKIPAQKPNISDIPHTTTASPAPAPEQNVTKPIPKNAQFEMHEVKESSKPQVAQPAKVYTAEPKKPAKPPVEITAAKLFSWIGGFMLF